MCKSSDKDTKERLDKLIELQKTAHACQVSNDHSRDKGIHQSSSRYSLIIFQSLIFLIILGTVIYCYCCRPLPPSSLP